MFHISTSHITQNAFALKGIEVQSDLHKKLGANPQKNNKNNLVSLCQTCYFLDQL